MKYLNSILLIAAFAAGPLGYATDDPNTQIVEAFSRSTLVKVALDELKKSDATLQESKIDVVGVAGSCGVAGCDNTYLVVQQLSHHGTNVYYKTVSAIVTAPAVGIVEVVKIVDLKQ